MCSDAILSIQDELAGQSFEGPFRTASQALVEMNDHAGNRLSGRRKQQLAVGDPGKGHIANGREVDDAHLTQSSRVVVGCTAPRSLA